MNPKFESPIFTKNPKAEGKSTQPARKDFERIEGNGLSEFIRYLHSPLRIIWSNFLAGIFRGLGFVLGATAVFALAIYILIQVLGNIPWVGEYFARIGEFAQDLRDSADTLKSLGR